MKCIQIIIISILLALTVSCDGGLKTASSRHKGIKEFQASAKPTLNPQKDAEMLMKEQINIMGSNKSSIDKFEAQAKLTNNYAKAYTNAHQEQGYKEMNRIGQELFVDEMLENDKSFECFMSFLIQIKEEGESMSEKEKKEYLKKAENISKKYGQESLAIMNTLTDMEVDKQKFEQLGEKIKEYSEKHDLISEETKKTRELVERAKDFQ